MLSRADVERYERDGFIVVPDVLTGEEVAGLRQATDELVERSRGETRHTEVYDLEPGHSAAEPRVRRIKTPDKWDRRFAAIVRHPRVIACLSALWGPNIRFDSAKLNMKAAGFGAPVEWHQDWAFYPHTNDDLAAVGVMIDDMAEENGPLMVIPRSHQGPVHDHHSEGRFCGAMDLTKTSLDIADAEPCLGKAGSISIHHVRAIHASAPNRSARPRRFFLLQFRSADAWPLLNAPDWETWRNLLVAGEEKEPRLADVRVRLPLPAALNQGSIYENQRDLKHRFFEPAEAAAAT